MVSDAIGNTSVIPFYQHSRGCSEAQSLIKIPSLSEVGDETWIINGVIVKLLLVGPVGPQIPTPQGPLLDSWISI